MTLRISRDNGFIVLDSSKVSHFEFNQIIYHDLPVVVHTVAGAFNISVENLSDLADQGFELAKEAIAMYAAHRMTHPEQTPKPAAHFPSYEHLMQALNIKDHLIGTQIEWAKKTTGTEELPYGKR